MEKPKKKTKTTRKIIMYPDPIPATRTAQNIQQCNLKISTPLAERTTANGWCTFG